MKIWKEYVSRFHKEMDLANPSNSRQDCLPFLAHAHVSFINTRYFYTYSQELPATIIK